MKLLLIGILTIAAAFSQTVVQQPAQFNFVVQSLPGAVPTSLTCVVGYAVGCIYRLTASGNSTDPYVCGGDIEASGQTITLQDANAVTLLNNALGTSGNLVTWWFPTPLTSKDEGCRIFPGGVYIQASASGATFRLTIKFNK